ncbi:hypothetical protein ACVIGB_006131 [Bradyrhizobium sp. USDA 4341]
MSDHQLRFKGPFFEFDGKGLGILAAIVLVAMLIFSRFLY